MMMTTVTGQLYFEVDGGTGATDPFDFLDAFVRPDETNAAGTINRFANYLKGRVGGAYVGTATGTLTLWSGTGAQTAQTYPLDLEH